MTSGAELQRANRTIEKVFFVVWCVLATFWSWSLLAGGERHGEVGSLLLALSMANLSAAQLLRPRRIAKPLMVVVFVLLGASLYMIFTRSAV